MEFWPNLPVSAGLDPVAWARDMEAQGWHGICASDHLWVGQTVYPHVFVTLAAMATATRASASPRPSPTTCSARRWSSPRRP